MNLSFRTLLFFGFIAISFTIGLFSAFIGVHLISKNIIPAAEDKVRLNLNSAREILQVAQSHVKRVTRLTAERFFLNNAPGSQKTEELALVLEAIRQKEGLDILTITDHAGKVIVRARNPGKKGYLFQSRRVMEEVESRKTSISSLEVLSREELSGEGEDLARRAYIKIIPTLYSKKAVKDAETSGLFLIGAAPILNDQGDISWILWGGKLLNHDDRIIEKIKWTVSENEQYHGRDVCSVSISLNDVRISANIKKDNGERAVGTLLSEEVYKHVFLSGEKWLKRAFVVNDYYIKAYEPIRDISGTPIGVLGLGLLESKFKKKERDVLTLFLGIMFGGIALAVIVCSFLTRFFTKPLDALMSAKEELASGNLGYSVDVKKFPEEIAVLGNAFNRMAKSIYERDRQLRRQAQEKIKQSERLAMIGRLASGIAHEINNPLGSILLFSRLLLQKAPSEGLQRENLERIERETRRCQHIVQGLLDFARTREPNVEPVNMNTIVDKTINLFENQPMFHNVQVVKQYQEDLPDLLADPDQIMQVFANIIMNAVDAMNSQGTLTIETSEIEDQHNVEIRFSDTGSGIPPEAMDKVFDPFFTTKDVGRGTGLGLSVSFGIVEGQGGTIIVHSTIGKGSMFIVSLPITKE